MLWPLSVVLVTNTNGGLAIPALAGLLVWHTHDICEIAEEMSVSHTKTMEIIVRHKKNNVKQQQLFKGPLSGTTR